MPKTMTVRPLFIASDHGYDAVVQALLAKGANINAKTNLGATPLMAAAFDGHRDVVQALLAKGANVNAKNSSGVTALMGAASRPTAMWCRRCWRKGPTSMPRPITA